MCQKAQGLCHSGRGPESHVVCWADDFGVTVTSRDVCAWFQSCWRRLPELLTGEGAALENRMQSQALERQLHSVIVNALSSTSVPANTPLLTRPVPSFGDLGPQAAGDGDSPRDWLMQHSPQGGSGPADAGVWASGVWASGVKVVLKV